MRSISLDQGTISRRALLAAAAGGSAALITGLGPGRALAATASRVATGVDYSWGRPSPAVTASQGYSFVCRYVSYDTTGKALSASEAQALIAAGLNIVLVWENSSTEALKGYATGAQSARDAQSMALACGMPASRPIYFAVDFDATPGQQTAIDSYFDGVASVLGNNRTGAYGGYYPIQRLFNNGKITWGWQTYAWSGGQWDPRAQLRQVQNGIVVDGADCDRDEAWATDYGQWGGGSTSGIPPWPIVVQGQTGPDVQAAQYLLRSYGSTIDADGQFGPATFAAAKAFQSARGLSVDGQIGPQTWSALITLVQSGSSGDAVRAAQTELNKYGYGLSVDGGFGPNTDRAARSFQSTHALVADGVVGPKTWQTLVGG